MNEIVESSSLKIEAGCSSETPKNCYQTARHQSQETVYLKRHCWRFVKDFLRWVTHISL